LIHFQVMPLSSLRAMPTPRVAANSVPSSSAVTALTNTPCRARCLTVHPRSVRANSATPSTVPIRIWSERDELRWIFVPPLESRIMGWSVTLAPVAALKVRQHNPAASM
jgi:hypothetical protein